LNFILSAPVPLSNPFKTMERERKYYVSKHSVVGNENVSLNKKLRRPLH